MRSLMILCLIATTAVAQQGYNYQNNPQQNYNFGPQPSGGQLQVAFNSASQQAPQPTAQLQIKFNPGNQEQPQLTFNSPGSVPASTPVSVNLAAPHSNVLSAQHAYLPPVSHQFPSTAQVASRASFQSAPAAAVNAGFQQALAGPSATVSADHAVHSAQHAYLPPVSHQFPSTAQVSSGASLQSASAAAAAANTGFQPTVSADYAVRFDSRGTQSGHAFGSPTGAAPLNPTSSNYGFSNGQSHEQPHPLQQQQPPVLNNDVAAHDHHDHHDTQHVEEIVTKNFYLHSAPDEEEGEEQTKEVTTGPVRKNFNVVFIKAPADSPKASLIKLAQPQNEDRTIIYVLAKKTDPAELQTHLAEQTPKVNKPEVFFIKYKTPEEAVHAQQQIQAQYDSLGGTSQVSDEGIAPVQSVIGSLETAHHAAANTDALNYGTQSQADLSLSHNHLNAGPAGYLPPSH